MTEFCAAVRERAGEVIRQAWEADGRQGPWPAGPGAVSVACGVAGIAGLFMTMLAVTDDSWWPGVVLWGGGLWLTVSAVLAWLLLAFRREAPEDGS